MIVRKVVEDIIAVIERDIDGLRDKISAGHCKSFEEYKAMCGEIRGKRDDIARIREQLKRTEVDDD